MRESRCIICGEKKDGLEVKEDFVIEAIRWTKRNVTKGVWPEKGSRLVVCKGCFPKYSKYRSTFIRRSTLYPTLAILFLIVLVAISPNKLVGFAYGLIMAIIIAGMSLLNYMPALKMPKHAAK